jgi:hypothetical protein
MSETVLQVKLVEVTNHIFCLIFAIVDRFDTIENDNQYYFMRHNASLLIEVFIAFLNTFDS